MIRLAFSSLRMRLLLLVLLAVLPVSALTLFTVWGQRRLAAEDVQSNALRIARTATMHHDRIVESARQLLVGLAQLAAVRSHDGAACAARLAAVLERFPVYANVTAIKPNGEVFCSGTPRAVPLNVADRAYFRDVLATGDFTVSDYQTDGLARRPNLTVAQPVLDEAGALQAVVAVAVDLTWLNQVVSRVELPEGATLVVMDRGGRVLARAPEPGEWIGESITDVPIVRAILSERRDGTAERRGVDGTPRLFGFTPLRGPRGATGYVAVGIARHTALAAADGVLARNLAVLGLAALLTLVAATVGSDLLVLRRVDALVGAARRLGSGDLAARTGLGSGRGELSELARAFDDMAAALEEREQALSRARDGLEVRVTERTAELGEANERLRVELQRVRRLQGLLPICAWCKKIRNDRHYWQAIESYISEHSEAQFTHGICPDCLAKLEGPRRA